MKQYTIIDYIDPGKTHRESKKFHDRVTIQHDSPERDDFFFPIVELYRGVIHIPHLYRNDSFNVSIDDGVVTWTAAWPLIPGKLSSSYIFYVVSCPSIQTMNNVLSRSKRLERHLKGSTLKYGQYWRDITSLLRDTK